MPAKPKKTTPKPPPPVHPGRVPWRSVVLLLLALTGTAGFIAVDFAARLKDHVVLQTLMAYSLLWLLLAQYGRSHRRSRRIACSLLWLTAAVFLSFLCFIHWDDIDARVVMAGQGWIRRAPAPLLWAACGLDAAAVLVWTAHALFLGWGGTPRAEASATASAPSGDAAPAGEAAAATEPPSN